jgi:hypothetical protein
MSSIDRVVPHELHIFQSLFLVGKYRAAICFRRKDIFTNCNETADLLVVLSLTSHILGHQSTEHKMKSSDVSTTQFMLLVVRYHQAGATQSTANQNAATTSSST